MKVSQSWGPLGVVGKWGVIRDHGLWFLWAKEGFEKLPCMVRVSLVFVQLLTKRSQKSNQNGLYQLGRTLDIASFAHSVFQCSSD